jgi:cellulose synthase/poly-beta-1,6-N-acetylglucosamine synthase-like glycosyltransferase
MVYCTCDDFSEESLRASILQNYPNYRVVILDDSSSRSYRALVDAFAARHNVTVVRRPSRTGFKAGNLNNYLTQAAMTIL